MGLAEGGENDGCCDEGCLGLQKRVPNENTDASPRPHIRPGTKRPWGDIDDLTVRRLRVLERHDGELPG